MSIAPILAVPGIREAVAAHPRVVGISNLIAGAAVRGPADRMLADLGIEASCVGVARGYQDLCAAFVIDEQDAARADEVEALGVRAVVTDTLMKDRRSLRRSRARRSPPSPDPLAVTSTTVPAFVEARRSIRTFLPEPVPADVLDTLVQAACLAPAPHHSRPWRWAIVDTPGRPRGPRPRDGGALAA